jgi:hypothetical protein
MIVWLKLAFCVTLALAAHAGVLPAARRPDEVRLLKRLIVGTVMVKFAAAVAIYAAPSGLGSTSDAGLFYIDQARHVLAGEMPYRDFDSSYSFLFPVILAPAVAIWNSIGAVVLVMTVMETVMLWLYLRASPGAGSPTAYRTAFLYSVSPISTYWCALTGYNGSIIALFAMASLLLADRRRNIGAATTAVVGFLLSKLLMALTFPAVICFERRGSIVRGAVLIGLWAATIGGPFLAGINTLQPIAREMANITAGNLWFLLSPFVSEETRRTPWWNVAPLVTFACVFTALFVPYARAVIRARDGAPRFDAAAAFLAATNLLFMIVSKKAFGFYVLMFLPFVLHTIVSSSGDLRTLSRRLMPVTFLGAVTTIQDRLWMIVRDRPLTEYSPALATLWVLDAVNVTCYVYLLVFCYRESLRDGAAGTVGAGDLGTHGK